MKVNELFQYPDNRSIKQNLNKNSIILIKIINNSFNKSIIHYWQVLVIIRNMYNLLRSDTRVCQFAKKKREIWDTLSPGNSKQGRFFRSSGRIQGGNISLLFPLHGLSSYWRERQRVGPQQREGGEREWWTRKEGRGGKVEWRSRGGVCRRTPIFDVSRQKLAWRRITIRKRSHS